MGIYLYLASQTFLKDKISFAFDLNKSAVTTIASELDVALPSAVYNLRNFALTEVSSNSKAQHQILAQALENDPLIASILVFELDDVFGTTPRLLSSVAQEKFSQTYEVTQAFWTTTLIQKKPIPFEKLKDQNTPALWNASLEKAPPLIGMAIKISFDEVTRARETKTEMRRVRTLVAVGFLKTSAFLKAINSAQTSDIYVLDGEGKLLIHPDSTFLVHNYNYKSIPIVADFIQNPTSPLTVKKYVYHDTEFLGAFARTSFANLGVFSSIESEAAFEAVFVLLKRSMVFGLIIILSIIIIAQIFSASITNPVRDLVSATYKVAEGDLDTVVDIKTHDEMNILGRAFNKMTHDLKKSRFELEETNRGLEEKVKERTRELQELATKDPLTGAYNRRFFTECLKNEIARHQRTEKELGLIYLDIDHFKKYNDTNGHPGGDILLKSFTKILNLNVRKSDILARVGGEEFCIILPEASLSGTRIVAEKIRAAVEGTQFPNGDKQPLGKVTCSFGISIFPLHAGSEEDLIKAADEALYKIKQTSRNAVGVAETDPNYAVRILGAIELVPKETLDDKAKKAG